MKKLISALLVVSMILLLASCGSTEPTTATYRTEMEQNGLVMVDTMTIDAKGDSIEKMTEIIEMDFSAFDDATIEQFYITYDALVEQYNSVEGVECTSEPGDKSYTMTVVIDATGDAVGTLAEMGLLAVEGNADGVLSLKATEEALLNSGFEKVE